MEERLSIRSSLARHAAQVPEAAGAIRLRFVHVAAGH